MYGERTAYLCVRSIDTIVQDIGESTFLYLNPCKGRIVSLVQGTLCSLSEPHIHQLEALSLHFNTVAAGISTWR